MTNHEIHNSISSRKIHLNKDERIDYWLSFMFLSIPLIIFGYSSVVTTLNKNEFQYEIIVIFLVFILLIRFKLTSTKLDVFKSNITESAFRSANEAAAKLNDWTILTNENGRFSAMVFSNWQWDGIRVTAFLSNKRLFMNSMVYPSIRSNPFTFGMNMKNKSELIKQYQLILKGNDVKADVAEELERNDSEFWSESELSSRNLVMKLIGYPLGIGFLALGYWMISQEEVKSLVIGILVIGIVLIYFYNDFKIMLEKRNRRKEARL